MKILSEPSSGKIRNEVAYIGRYGQCRREYVIPKNTWSPARDHMRGSFGRLSRAWSGLLTEAQRDAWCDAGPKVQSAKRLGDCGPLTGQQFFQGINSARSRIGQDMLFLPPDPVVFSPNPVGQLVITNDEDGVRLLLTISKPVAEDIMVFGQAPCSSGRRKRRNVSYLGLLPAPQDGLADITDLYTTRFGEPGVGQRVFIVTRQQKDGWEAFDHETSEVVPPNPSEQQAIATQALPLQGDMHKGCTRDAQGTMALPAPEPQVSGKPVAVSRRRPHLRVRQVSRPAEFRIMPRAEASVKLPRRPPSYRSSGRRLQQVCMAHIGAKGDPLVHIELSRCRDVGDEGPTMQGQGEAVSHSQPLVRYSRPACALRGVFNPAVQKTRLNRVDAAGRSRASCSQAVTAACAVTRSLRKKQTEAEL